MVEVRCPHGVVSNVLLNESEPPRRDGDPLPVVVRWDPSIPGAVVTDTSGIADRELSTGTWVPDDDLPETYGRIEGPLTWGVIREIESRGGALRRSGHFLCPDCPDDLPWRDTTLDAAMDSLLSIGKSEVTMKELRAIFGEIGRRRQR